MKAVTIMSGGLDSTTLVYYMLHEYKILKAENVHALSFNYGQRHAKELYFAGRMAEKLGLQHDIVDVKNITSLLAPSHSSLVDTHTDVPEGHYAAENMKQTVVPNRNMIMLAIACGAAVADGAEVLGFGAHSGDYEVYPDCRPGFVNSIERAMRIGNEGFLSPHFDIFAPFLNIGKHDIVKIGHELGVPFEDTWSCYVGADKHCGRCGTCVERAEAFHLANVPDPTVYEDPDYWKSQVGNAS